MSYSSGVAGGTAPSALWRRLRRRGTSRGRRREAACRRLAGRRRVAGLPGFAGARGAAGRRRSRPRYQVRVHMRNDEPTPGLVELRNSLYNGAFRRGPYRMPSNATVEIGTVETEPPNQLWLYPCLALNRDSIPISLPAAVDSAKSNDAPFVGTRPSDWRPPAVEGIVVDDLDTGFSVQRGEDDPRLDTDAVLATTPLDQGLLPPGDLENGPVSGSSRPGAGIGAPPPERCQAAATRWRHARRRCRTPVVGAWTTTCRIAFCRQPPAIPAPNTSSSRCWTLST